MGEACNAHEIKQRRSQDNGCKTRTHEIDLLRDMELFYVVSQVFTNFYLGLFHILAMNVCICVSYCLPNKVEPIWILHDLVWNLNGPQDTSTEKQVICGTEVALELY